MHKNEMPKTVARWLEKNQDKLHAIDIEDTDPNEHGDYSIWVYFNAGHSREYGWESMHLIHEYTAQDFLTAVKDVRHCPKGCPCKWDSDPSEGSVGSGGFANDSNFIFDETGKLIRRTI
jgi:hypothetical protein